MVESSLELQEIDLENTNSPTKNDDFDQASKTTTDTRLPYQFNEFNDKNLSKLDPHDLPDYDPKRDDPDRKPKLSSTIMMYLQLTMTVSVFTVAMPTSLELIENMGGTKELAGLMVGLVNMMAAPFGWPFLWLMNTIGIKKSQMCANVITIIGCVLYSLSYTYNSIPMIMIARCLQGVGSQGFSTQFFSRAAGLNVRSKYFIAMGACIGIGYGWGPIMGAVMLASLAHTDPTKSKVFNVYTGPGWLMTFIYITLFFCTWFFFEDPLLETPELKDLIKLKKRKLMSIEEKELEKKEKQRIKEEKLKNGEVTYTKSEKFGLIINLCMFAVFPIVISCWEIHAFNVCQRTWNWSMLDSALYIGGLMLFIVPINASAGPILQKWKWSDRKSMSVCFGMSLFSCILFFDFFQETEHYIGDMVVWTIGSVIFLTAFQICRASASALITKQVRTEDKPFFNVLMGTIIYMLSRGIGAIIGDLFEWDLHGVHHYDGISPNNVFAVVILSVMVGLILTFICVYKHLVPHRNAT